MPDLFDVVIYELKTGKVDSIAGKAMQREAGHYNAERRMDTVMPRLNDRYNASIVPAGKYAVGDKLKKEDR